MYRKLKVKSGKVSHPALSDERVQSIGGAHVMSIEPRHFHQNTLASEVSFNSQLLTQHSA
jgi:hypothetical protein